MSIYLKLVNALIKSVEPTGGEKKRRKIFYYVMSFIAVFFIMIPMAFLVGVTIYTLTSPLVRSGSGQNAIELFLHLISVFSFVFGINVIFSVFYFSGDIENLLPLPLQPSQIILSKFTAALISESIMEFIVIIAAFAGYIIAAGLPFQAWFIAVLGMLTLPIVPLIYCAVLCMFIMLVCGFVRNKDSVNKITGFLTFAVIAGIAYIISQAGGFDTEHLVNAIADPNNPVLSVMNIIFPHVHFLVSSMVNNTLVNMLYYIGVNLVAVGLFMMIAELIYFRTVAGVTSSGIAKGKSLDESVSRLRQSPVALTYLKKEFRILFRTPAYFTNCVLINLIWPLFIYLLYVLQGKTNFLDSFVYGIRSGNEETVLLFILAVSALSVLVTAANCIASSAITREGRHFAFMKYIPVPYMTQLNVKAAASIIISGIGMIIYVIAAAVYLHMGIKLSVFCCIISLLSVSFVSYFGIYMDSVNPKLVWDDELNSLRGNYNIFFNMALAIVLEGVTCAGAYLLFRYTGLGALMIIIMLLLFIMLLNVVCYLLCAYRGKVNIDRLNG